MKKIGFSLFVSLTLLYVGCGDSGLKGVEDKVLVAPTAVAGKDVHMRTDENVTLTAEGSVDPDGSIIAYSWEENGTVLSTGVELKEYSSKVVGRHIITLKILDNDELNATDTVNIFVTLENQAPIADAGEDKKIYVGEKITLDGNRSSDSDGEIVSYEWIDRDTKELLSTGVELVNYTLTTKVGHTLQLTVTDNEGLSSSDSVYISSLNRAPVAKVGEDKTIRIGKFITLDGNRSEDVDGEIVTYRWVEDGAVLSTGENLENYMTEVVGEHNITLTVTDNDGDSDSDNLIVTALPKNVAPIADAGDNISIKIGTKVTLDGNSSIDSDGSIVEYIWKERGKTLSSDEILSDYLPTTVGIHTVTLTVTDNEGASSSDDIMINVLANVAPIANAGNDVSIRMGEKITLDANESSDSDGLIERYLWEESNRTIGTSEQLIDYSTATAGIHTVTLTVTDNDGASSSDDIFINVVENAYPLANAGNDQTIRVSETITLDGSKSNDLDGTIVRYAWVEDGVILSTGEDLIDYHSTKIGVHTITLTVFDNDDYNSSDSVEVTVRPENVAPVADAGDDKNTRIGRAVLLDGSGSVDSDGKVISYEWIESAVTLGTATTLKYSTERDGVHTVALTITDNEGLTSSDTVTVTVVGNSSPIADAGENKRLRVGESVTLDGTKSNDLDGEIVKYAWVEGEVLLSTGEKLLNYKPTDVGTHLIELTVTDNDGLTNSDNTDVEVRAANIAPVADAGVDQTIERKEKITLSASKSEDSDGTIVAYEWKEGSKLLGTAIDLPYSSSLLGGHTITLKVRDNEGLEDTDSVYITVTN